MIHLKMTSPSHLYMIATLFHLQAKDYQTARILDLNLTADSAMLLFASHYKNTKIIAWVQKAHRAKVQEAVNLFNLDNIHIKETGEALEGGSQFDYILCDDLYSYVSPDLAQAILKIAAQHLAPEGIISISYNTLPGWNMRRSIAQMMRYHVLKVAPDQKVPKARALLTFLIDGIGNETVPYARFLKEEIQRISYYTDEMIYRDYLEDINEAYYFHEFIEKVHEYQLAYLSDSYLPLMFPGNLKEKLKSQIEQMTDVLQMGQYLDFLRNQSHRTTLLCHQAHTVNRHLKIEALREAYIAYAGLYPPIIHTKALASGRLLEFEVGGPVPLKISLTDPLAKIAMKVLCEQGGKSITYVSLVKKTMHASRATLDQVQALFQNELNLARLLLTGLIKIMPDKGAYPANLSSKPQTLPLIQWIANFSAHVPNLLNESYVLTAIERLLLCCIKGDKLPGPLLTQFESLLKQKLQTGEILLSDELGQPLTDKKAILRQIKKLSKTALDNLRLHAFLS